MDYVKIGAKPNENDLVAEYYFEPARGVAPACAAEQLAAESSIGTWTAIATLKPETAKRLAPKIFYLKKKGRGFITRIAYPDELFEEGNAPQIMSAIAGNVFGMKVVENLRLESVSFTKKLLSSFKGPAVGLQGIRDAVKIYDKPLLGTIVKPKVGLSAREHARVAYECWVGGLQVVKDDENLSDMSFNRFKDRVVATLKARDKAEKETGERKLAVLNVTSETSEMIRRARFIKDCGGEVAMIDVLTAGWSAFQSLRNADLGLILHCHRAGHAAITRNPRHGISMQVIAELVRLIGGDQLHIGTFGVGKMAGSGEDDLLTQKVLTEKMGRLKPVLPVCSGGLHPGSVSALVKKTGKNVLIQFGGGCHGHPKGTLAGAKAIRQALDAVMQETSLSDYAEDHAELKLALGEWGVVR